MSSKFLKICIVAVLTLLAVALGIIYFDSDILCQILNNTNLLFFALFFVVYAATYVLRAVRLQGLYAEARIPWLSLWSTVSLSSFFNFLIPARIGDLSMAYYLNKYCNIELDEAVGMWLAVRIMDALCLLLMFDVLLVSYCFMHHEAVQLRTFCFSLNIVGISGLAIVGFGGGFLYGRGMNLAKVVSSLVSRKQGRFVSFLVKVVLGLSGIPAKALLRAFVLSLCIFMLQLVAYWAGIRATSLVTMDLVSAALGAYGAILTLFLPINTVAGVGSMQAGWVGSLTLLGYPGAVALNIGIFFHIYLLVCSSFLAFSGWGTRLWQLWRTSDLKFEK